MIKLRVDTRDLSLSKHVGQVTQGKFPDQLNYDGSLFDDVQPPGNVECTCYTVCDIAEDQNNIEFDIKDLWKRIVSTAFGADPREPLGKAASKGVDGGLLPVGQTVRLKNWSTYFRADTGSFDAFDNVRSALMIAQSPVGAATYWYDEWLTMPTPLPVGQNTLNGHMYSIEGWTQINGQPHLIIEAWVGKKLYMSREVFNTAMAVYGATAWVLSTKEIDERRTRTMLEWIRDLLQNVVALYKQLLVTKTIPPPVEPVTQTENEVVTPKRNMIAEWAKAIDVSEGNTFGNNPGNLKYSTLTSQYGAKKGNKAKDGGNFAKFDTHQQGFDALCAFLTLGCKDQLKDYHKARTFKKFMTIYAGNPPLGYIEAIRKALGCQMDTDISTFLS